MPRIILLQIKNKFMKRIILLSCMLIASVCRSSATYTTVTVSDSISTNTHWTCDKQYLLKGYVYVTAGATLTIDAGTIIKGDKDTKGALIVERNAKLMAMGTVTSPIVFTSAQDAGNRTYGDWGGVILCGNAPVNWAAGYAQVEGGPRSLYGGSDPHDNSGELHYVRIEFAGIAFSPNNEVNGLTLCGVGDATKVDHIQVSYSGDDAVEFFGGTVNTKYMVALATWDDDFDTDNGYQGKNQFCVVVRDPYAADNSGSKAFESDSYQGNPAPTYSGIPADVSKMTRPVFSNCTIIGPLVSPTSTAWDPQFVAGAQIRRGSALSILNSVFAGWPATLLIDESAAAYGSTVANIGSGELQFKNNIISGTSSTGGFPKDIVFVKDGARSLTPTTSNADSTSTGTDWSVLAMEAGPWTWLKDPANHNTVYPTEQTGVRLGNPFNLSNPGLVPTSSSPICFNSAHAFNPNHPINYDTSGGYVNYNVPAVAPDFSSTKASDPFFTVTNYVGAFAGTGTSTDNWMKGWCEFNPNNADYDVTCYVAPIDTTTSVANVGNSNFGGAKVFPNPASGNATLLMNVLQTGTVKINVIDMTGKVAMEVYNGVLTSGEQTIDFNTDRLTSGMYIISITSDKRQKTIRFSVVK